MWNEGWREAERVLSSTRARCWLLSSLLLVFLAVRWFERLEPWNSDDLELFQLSVQAASGQHWLFGVLPAAGSVLSHQALRIGLLPVAVPLIRAFGASGLAYHLVPLAFALLGFCAIYWLLSRHFGPLLALVFGLIHVVWPLELQHSSVFLTDLPAAATGVLSLCLLDAAARRAGRARLAWALLAGLAALESQLLRNNALVLLAPALLFLLWSRPTRPGTLLACAVVLLGVLGQQAFFVYRGLGWGYDWSRVRMALAEYSEFLPVYSWPAFLVRQFKHQVSIFGRGPTGIFALILLVASLSGHAWLLWSERRPLLRALAAFGLFTWLVFSFSIYERVPGGVRAMAPLNFRYLQPFAYSSLVVWAWLWAALRERARAGWLSPRLELGALLALPGVLLVFSCAADAFHLPGTYRRGATRRLVQALESRAGQASPPLVIAGTSSSLPVPRLFAASRLEWRELLPGELADALERQSQLWVLRDIPRELNMAQYFTPELRASYRRDLSRIEERLWHDAQLEYVDAKYALFSPRSAVAQTLTSRPGTAPSSEPAGAPLLSAPACPVSAPAEGAARTLEPIRAGRSRPVCEYSWLADGLVLEAAASADATALVLRLKSEYELPLSLAVDVVEVSEHGQRRQPTTLSPGTAYVPVPLHAGTRSVYLVYRVSGRGGLDEQAALRVWPAEWRAR